MRRWAFRAEAPLAVVVVLDVLREAPREDGCKTLPCPRLRLEGTLPPDELVRRA